MITFEHNNEEFRIVIVNSVSALSKVHLLLLTHGCSRPSCLQEEFSTTFAIQAPIKGSDKFKTVGTACIGRPNNFSLEIFHLCIHPDYRRKGFGQKLLKEVLTSFKAKKKEIIFSHVDAENTASCKLFESLGFNTLHVYNKTQEGITKRFKVYNLLLKDRERLEENNEQS